MEEGRKEELKPSAEVKRNDVLYLLPTIRKYAFIVGFCILIGLLALVLDLKWMKNDFSLRKLEVSPRESTIDGFVLFDVKSSILFSSIEVSSFQCNLKVLKEKSESICKISTTNTFFLVPDQKLDFQTNSLNVSLFLDSFESFRSGKSDMQISYDCSSKVTAHLGKLFPIVLGTKSFTGKIPLANHKKDQQQSISLYSASSKNSTQHSSKIPEFQFTSSSIDFSMKIGSISEIFPFTVPEFIVNIPRLCQLATFQGIGPTSGYQICVKQQSLNVVSENQKIYFFISPLKFRESLINSLLYPLTSSVQLVSSGLDLQVTSSPSQANVLNYFAGIETSNSFSISHGSMVSSEQAQTKFTTSSMNYRDCMRIANTFFGFISRMSICIENSKISVNAAAFERNTIDLFIHIDGNHHYELLLNVSLIDLDTHLKGSFSITTANPIAIHVTEPLTVSRISNPTVIDSFLSSQNYIALSIDRSLTEIHIYGFAKFFTIDEMFSSEVSLQSFPDITLRLYLPYEMSMQTNPIEIFHHLSTYVDLESAYVDYVPKAIKQAFRDAFSFGVSLYQMAAYIVWNYGRLEPLYNDLVTLGISEGWYYHNVVNTTLVSFTSVISIPSFTPHNILLVSNLDSVYIRGYEYDTHCKVSLAQENDTFQFSGLMSFQNVRGSELLSVNFSLYYTFTDVFVMNTVKEDISISVFHRMLYSTKSSRSVHINLGTPSPSRSPTTSPLPHILHQWLSCEYYSAFDTMNATMRYKRCAFRICPKETATISLCGFDSVDVAFYGDPYLRITSIPEGSTNWTEYAVNDDACGLGSRITFTPNVSKCSDYQIVEGCFSSESCGGRVGVLLSSINTQPTMSPVAVVSKVLPRTLNMWQTCPSFFQKGWTEAPLKPCLFSACPGDQVIISNCWSDNGFGSGSIQISLFDHLMRQYVTTFRSMDCAGGQAFVYKTEGYECGTFSLQPYCYGGCGGNYGLYISPPNHIVGNLPSTSVSLTRKLGEWMSCGPFNLQGTGFLNGLENYCQVEICAGDRIELSTCPRVGFNFYGTGSALGYIDKTSFRVQPYSCHYSDRNEFMKVGSGCTTYNISLVCESGDCEGELGVRLDVIHPLTRSEQWNMCGNFSFHSFSLTTLCNIEVCYGDQIEISFCPFDDPRFLIDADYVEVYLSEYRDVSNESPLIYYPQYSERNGTSCYRLFYLPEPSSCTIFSVKLFGSTPSRGVAGIRYIHLNTVLPSTQPVSILPSVTPTTYPRGIQFRSLPYKFFKSMDCGAFTTSHSNSSVFNTSDCTIQLCPGDTLKASMCDYNDYHQPFCSGDTFLRLIDSVGRTIITNDDNCGICSMFEYTAPVGSLCGLYTIKQGCYGNERCSGQTTVSLSKPLRVHLPHVINEDLFCMPYLVSNTNSALKNTASCYVPVCENDILTVSFCDSSSDTPACEGDTFIRLFDQSGQLLSYDDDSDCGACSRLSYSSTVVGCRNLTISEGCYRMGTCSGTVKVVMTNPNLYPTMMPSNSPSPTPSVVPSQLPTSPLPTVVTSIPPSQVPTYSPSFAPTVANQLHYVRDIPQSCSPYITSYTTSATVNIYKCIVPLCSGDTLQASFCDDAQVHICTGDTFLRLVDESGTEVAADDDSDCGYCSLIRFQRFIVGCGNYTIMEGCYNTGTCGGTVNVMISGISTTLPTTAPAGRDTFHPTSIRPSYLPTMDPTTSLSPSIAVTTLPTIRPVKMLCPIDYSYSSDLGICYSYQKIGQSRDSAIEYCKAMNGFLMAASSAERQDFLYRFIGNGHSNLWIGLTLDHSGRRFWNNGESYDYSNWCPGQPDGNSESFCIYIWGDLMGGNGPCGGMWDDVDCRNPIPFVCETTATPLADIWSGLVAYYPFDDVHQGRVVDHGGNRLDGIIHDRIYTSVDRNGNYNQAIAFNGLRSYLEISGSLLTFKPPFSIAFWIYFPTIYDETITVLDKITRNESYQRLSIDIIGEGDIRSFVRFTREINHQIETVNAPITPNVWTHIGIAVNSSRIEIYIDGVLAGSLHAAFHGGTDPDMPVILGAKVNGDSIDESNLINVFHGALDELFFFERWLNASEIMRIMRNGSFAVPEFHAPSFQPTSDPTSSPTTFLSISNNDFEFDASFYGYQYKVPQFWTAPPGTTIVIRSQNGNWGSTYAVSGNYFLGVQNSYIQQRLTIPPNTIVRLSFYASSRRELGRHGLAIFYGEVNLGKIFLTYEWQYYEVFIQSSSEIRQEYLTFDKSLFYCVGDCTFFLDLLTVNVIPGTALIRSGLHSFYPFDGNINDYSGNNRNGFASDLIFSIDRKGNDSSCASFDGSHSFIAVEDYGISYGIESNISIAFWMKVISEDGRTGVILEKKAYVGPIIQQSIVISHEHNQLFFTWGTSTGDIRIPSFMFIPNTWIHVGLVKKDDRIVFYCNGIKSGTTTVTHGLSSFLFTDYLPLMIGAHDEPQGVAPRNLRDVFYGCLDDLYFYNRSLTSVEIAALYIKGSNSPSFSPTLSPSFFPTSIPTRTPDYPSSVPSGVPSEFISPSSVPSSSPTELISPTTRPSSTPTELIFPTSVPSISVNGYFTYIVPNETNALAVNVCGAKGLCIGYSYLRGGAGGCMKTIVPVEPGQTIFLVIGSPGDGGKSFGSPIAGYGNGGGASDIRTSLHDLSSRIAVGGGGGGCGHGTSQNGGVGGGLIGGIGGYGCCDSAGGKGGTQTAGGTGATFVGRGADGTFGFGGNAVAVDWGGAGGGGNGWYGGGGGFDGGGGGSSYSIGEILSNGQGDNDGGGYIEILSPRYQFFTLSERPVPTSLPSLLPTSKQTLPTSLPSNATNTPSSIPSSPPTGFPSTKPSQAPITIHKPHTILPYLHQQWQYCAPYIGTNTNNAIVSAQDCTIQVCPGDMLTASLCSTDNSNIHCSGDTFLRLQDNFGKSIGTNDDGGGKCGRCSKLIYSMVEGSTCKNLTIKEGCYSSTKCEGTVGIYLDPAISLKPSVLPTSHPSSKPSFTESPSREPSIKPTFFPTTTSLTILPYSPGEWLTCGLFSTTNTNYGRSPATQKCQIQLCPKDTIVASLCASENKDIVCNQDPVLRFKSPLGVELIYDDDSCGLCPRIQYKVPDNQIGCLNYTIYEGCYYSDSCSGNVAVYVTSDTETPSISPTLSLIPTNTPSPTSTLSPTNTLSPTEDPTITPSRLPTVMPTRFEANPCEHFSVCCRNITVQQILSNSSLLNPSRCDVLFIIQDINDRGLVSIHENNELNATMFEFVVFYKVFIQGVSGLKITAGQHLIIYDSFLNVSTLLSLENRRDDLNFNQSLTMSLCSFSTFLCSEMFEKTEASGIYLLHSVIDSAEVKILPSTRLMVSNSFIDSSLILPIVSVLKYFRLENSQVRFPDHIATSVLTAETISLRGNNQLFCNSLTLNGTALVLEEGSSAFLVDQLTVYVQMSNVTGPATITALTIDQIPSDISANGYGTAGCDWLISKRQPEKCHIVENSINPDTWRNYTFQRQMVVGSRYSNRWQDQCGRSGSDIIIIISKTLSLAGSLFLNANGLTDCIDSTNTRTGVGAGGKIILSVTEVTTHTTERIHMNVQGGMSSSGLGNGADGIFVILSDDSQNNVVSLTSNRNDISGFPFPLNSYPGSKAMSVLSAVNDPVLIDVSSSIQPNSFILTSNRLLFDCQYLDRYNQFEFLSIGIMTVSHSSSIHVPHDRVTIHGPDNGNYLIQIHPSYVDSILSDNTTSYLIEVNLTSNICAVTGYDHESSSFIIENISFPLTQWNTVESFRILPWKMIITTDNKLEILFSRPISQCNSDTPVTLDDFIIESQLPISVSSFTTSTRRVAMNLNIRQDDFADRSMIFSMKPLHVCYDGIIPLDVESITSHLGYFTPKTISEYGDDIIRLDTPFNTIQYQLNLATQRNMAIERITPKCMFIQNLPIHQVYFTTAVINGNHSISCLTPRANPVLPFNIEASRSIDLSLVWFDNTFELEQTRHYYGKVSFIPHKHEEEQQQYKDLNSLISNTLPTSQTTYIFPPANSNSIVIGIQFIGTNSSHGRLFDLSSLYGQCRLPNGSMLMMLHDITINQTASYSLLSERIATKLYQETSNIVGNFKIISWNISTYFAIMNYSLLEVQRDPIWCEPMEAPKSPLFQNLSKSIMNECHDVGNELRSYYISTINSYRDKHSVTDAIKDLFHVDDTIFLPKDQINMLPYLNSIMNQQLQLQINQDVHESILLKSNSQCGSTIHTTPTAITGNSQCYRLKYSQEASISCLCKAFKPKEKKLCSLGNFPTYEAAAAASSLLTPITSSLGGNVGLYSNNMNGSCYKDQVNGFACYDSNRLLCGIIGSDSCESPQYDLNEDIDNTIGGSLNRFNSFMDYSIGKISCCNPSSSSSSLSSVDQCQRFQSRTHKKCNLVRSRYGPYGRNGLYQGPQPSQKNKLPSSSVVKRKQEIKKYKNGDFEVEILNQFFLSTQTAESSSFDNKIRRPLSHHNNHDSFDGNYYQAFHDAQIRKIETFRTPKIDCCADGIDCNGPPPCGPNGCSTPIIQINLNFISCCNTHDVAYCHGGTEYDRLLADIQLRDCIIAHEHSWLAEIYFRAVQLFGRSHFCHHDDDGGSDDDGYDDGGGDGYDDDDDNNDNDNDNTDDDDGGGGETSGMGGSNGDVHYCMFDGILFDCHGYGEYFLIFHELLILQGRQRTPSGDCMDEARNSGVRPTITTGLALSIYLPSLKQVNVTILPTKVVVSVEGASSLIILTSDDHISLEGYFYLSFQNGVSNVKIGSICTIYASFPTVQVTLDPIFRKTIKGLYGNFDGDKTNDFILPNGKLSSVTSSSSLLEIYYNFGQHWRTTKENSVFYYDKSINESWHSHICDAFIPFNGVLTDSVETLNRYRTLCQTITNDPILLQQCIVEMSLMATEIPNENDRIASIISIHGLVQRQITIFNSPPVFTAPLKSHYDLLQYSSMVLKFQIIDPNSDVLHVNVWNLPMNASYDMDRNELLWQPASSISDAIFNISASDGLITVFKVISFNVLEVFPSSTPTAQPSGNPSNQPTSKPTEQPSVQPTAFPSSQPSSYPSNQPFSSPSSLPTAWPSSNPSIVPTDQPTAFPSSQPSGVPSAYPTAQPSVIPSDVPSAIPTTQPSCQPSSSPSAVPTMIPSGQPSSFPTGQPTNPPTSFPTGQPSSLPSALPSSQPTDFPTSTPSSYPSTQPSSVPTAFPSRRPSGQPTTQPSNGPSVVPSALPSGQPSNQPSSFPSSLPSGLPSGQPSANPTSIPSSQPTAQPTGFPSTVPSSSPTAFPSSQPSSAPSTYPSHQPSAVPTASPSCTPSTQPSSQPSSFPTGIPTIVPSSQPSSLPSSLPSSQPAGFPTGQPSANPTLIPSSQPTAQPTRFPSTVPSSSPTAFPSSQPSSAPSTYPSHQPSAVPTASPSCTPSTQPSSQPSSFPTGIPTIVPSSQPSSLPSSLPSSQPSSHPTSTPSSYPSTQPSSVPTAFPSHRPSGQPTTRPTNRPSIVPSSSPTAPPSRQPSSYPSSQPSGFPTEQPIATPTSVPSSQPSRQPTCIPSSLPTALPSGNPSCIPSSNPSSQPSSLPTNYPSVTPSSMPSAQPFSLPSSSPSSQPSSVPSVQPVSHPSSVPSAQPSAAPTAVPSGQPSSFPSPFPSSVPTDIPSGQPSSLPSSWPTAVPTIVPSSQPSAIPSTSPSTLPSSVPSEQPVSKPTSLPSAQPSNHPTTLPSTEPSSMPSETPSSLPTSQPSTQPSSLPTTLPTACPTVPPSTRPSSFPSSCPSSRPSLNPTEQPLSNPTSSPSSQPSISPTSFPSTAPSNQPTSHPTTSWPTGVPSSCPSSQPSSRPLAVPSRRPSSIPSLVPSAEPSSSPSETPAAIPTGAPSSSRPSSQPSGRPTGDPTSCPSIRQSSVPSTLPTVLPTTSPSTCPSSFPSSMPSDKPTSSRPSTSPTSLPTSPPSCRPTSRPSYKPNPKPSALPSCLPTTRSPITMTTVPTITHSPSLRPTRNPTLSPTFARPSLTPTRRVPTIKPSKSPFTKPSFIPTTIPTTEQPTLIPTFTMIQIKGSMTLNNINLNNLTDSEQNLLKNSLQESIAQTANLNISAIKNLTLESTEIIVFSIVLANELPVETDHNHDNLHKKKKNMRENSIQKQDLPDNPSSNRMILVEFLIIEFTSTFHDQIVNSSSHSDCSRSSSSSSRTDLIEIFRSLLDCHNGTNFIQLLNDVITTNIIQSNLSMTSFHDLLEAINQTQLIGLVTINKTPTPSPTTVPIDRNHAQKETGLDSNSLAIAIVIPIMVILLLILFICIWFYRKKQRTDRYVYVDQQQQQQQQQQGQEWRREELVVADQFEELHLGVDPAPVLVHIPVPNDDDDDHHQVEIQVGFDEEQFPPLPPPAPAPPHEVHGSVLVHRNDEELAL